MTIKVDNYFGGCPHCGRTDGWANISRSHWCFCKTHKTEDEQRRVYDEIGLGEFTEVKPLPCTDAGNASQPPADDGTPLPF